MDSFRELIKKIRVLTFLFYLPIVLLSAVLLILVFSPTYFFSTNENTNEEDITFIKSDDDSIVNGIHVQSGLIDAPGLMTVVNNCTNCHSAQLLTQNRMDSAGWESTIDWMQETQNLWDLGTNEEIIVNYLVTNYPISKKGRRQNLENIEWYNLK